MGTKPKKTTGTGAGTGDGAGSEPADDTAETVIAIESGHAARPPFDAGDMLRRWWAVLRRPRVATFDEQQDGASWPSIVIQLAVLGVLGALLTILVLRPNILAALVVNLAGAFLDFFAMVGLFYAAARVFGGKGSFMPYTYLLALIYVPLQIAGLAVSFVPYAGFFLLLALSAYQILLSIFATVSVHQLPMRRASIAVLVGYAVLLLLGSLLAQATGASVLAV